MVVLKAIGAFFARIGRWIRDTAWVQPLLIVGGIFAIIFSIPHIKSWVESWFVKTDAGEIYYRQREISCDGAKEGTSQAEELLTYMGEYANPVNFDYNAARAKYGEKFFLMFGYEGCPGCSTLYPAFSTATNEWKATFGMEDDYNFWFIDISSKDTLGDSLFVSNADYSIYSKFSDIFTKAAKVGEESNYYKHTSDKTSYKNNLNTNGNAGSKEDFVSPTVFVVDLSATSTSVENYGISQVFFSVPDSDLPSGPSSTLSYIEFLTQAWTGTGVFSEEGK